MQDPDVLVIQNRNQFFGSGFGLDPDSIMSVDPYPDPASDSRSGGPKITQKDRKKL
jgi:hypothetical protein